MVIGIDLGTTFSVVAAINADGKAEVVENRDGDRTTPSVVMFEDGAAVVGAQAKENSIVDPLNVCQFVKRQMGQKAFSFDVSMTERYTAEEISALILKRLKEDAEAARADKVEGVVITVPAYFDDAQRNATKDAGEIAGLNVLGIINEPTAAAIAYCHGQANSDGNVMVFDLGGGTFDITIMKLSENLEKVDILSTTGNRNLGGFDFDNVIISKVMEAFEDEYGIDLEDDEQACQDLRLKAETAKKALSARNKTNISIISGGKSLKVEITREEFDSLIRGHIESAKASMEIALEEAGLQWRDISKVLLVGGSTRVPAIKEMIQKVTGIVPSQELNPDEAVAIGAAYYADMIKDKAVNSDFASNKKKIKVTDVNSHSLGVITYDGEKRRASFILEKNTPLPASNEETFYTHCDNQTALLVEVVEGEDADPDYDTIIGECRLEIAPHPEGAPVSVKMEYDLNGFIHVSVFDMTDNVNLGEMKIERTSNLSEEEVREKRMLIDKIDIE